MIRHALLLCILGASAIAEASVLEADSSANPIRKIVTLLQDMQKEIANESEKEKELYDAYMCYCKTTKASLEAATESSKSKIAEASAALEESSSSKTSVDQELIGHKN